MRVRALSTWLDLQVLNAGRGDSLNELPVEPKGRFWKFALVAVLMTAVPPGHERDQPHFGGSMAFAASGPDGKSIFMQNCTTCHGDDGKGKATVGTPNFTDAKIQAGLSNQDMINIITNGKQGTIMPAWKGKLSTEEIAAAASFVRSLGPAGGMKSPK